MPGIAEKRLFYILFHAVGNIIGLDRYKKRTAADRKKSEPLPIKAPINLTGNYSHTVGVNLIKCVILAKPESEGIDAVSAGAAPKSAACVVARSVYLKNPCGQMRYRIAGDNNRIARGFPYYSVKLRNYFGARFAFVMKAPAVLCGYFAVKHTAKRAEKVVGGVIVLYKLIAPFGHFANGRPYILPNLGNGGVKAV